jgi:hypothetical protein
MYTHTHSSGMERKAALLASKLQTRQRVLRTCGQLRSKQLHVLHSPARWHQCMPYDSVGVNWWYREACAGDRWQHGSDNASTWRYCSAPAAAPNWQRRHIPFPAQHSLPGCMLHCQRSCLVSDVYLVMHRALRTHPDGIGWSGRPDKGGRQQGTCVPACQQSPSRSRAPISAAGQR